jgi:outer membrane protein assembly factor BamB
MRAWIATLAGLAGLSCGCSSSAPTERSPAPAKPAAPPTAQAAPPAADARPAPPRRNDLPEGDIVTADVLKMNGANYGRPAATFRRGSVSPIPAPSATRTKAGFQVQFASHATITTPTVYERKVLVSGGFRGKQLFAYEAGTGKTLWGIDLHDDGPSSPACEDGVCVVNTESCTMFALDAATGKQLWSYWLGDPLTSAPTIARGRVFTSYPQTTSDDPKKQRPDNANHALAAFDLKTGKVLWQLWLDSDVMSAPVAAGDFVYVTTFSGTMIKLEQETGKVRYAMKAKATSAPVVLFDGSGTEQMYYTRREAAEPNAAPSEMVIRADHNEPQTKWSGAKKAAPHLDKNAQGDSAYNASSKSQDAHNGFSGGAPAAAAADLAMDNVGVGSVSSMQSFQGSRVVHLTDKNVNTMGDEVIATDNETGAVVWKVKLPGDLRDGGSLGTAPLAAGGHVLLGTLKGEVLRLDPASGKSTATYAIGSPIRSQPVAADGWIYVGTEDGRLVAIDTKDPSITGWPTWGGNAQRTGVAR